MEENPQAGHTLQGTLYRLRSLELTVRGSDAFRAVYGVLEPDAVYLVILVGPHENICDTVERRVERLRAAGVL